jgi:AraC-like DNA-binding protein
MRFDPQDDGDAEFIRVAQLVEQAFADAVKGVSGDIAVSAVSDLNAEGPGTRELDEAASPEIVDPAELESEIPSPQTSSEPCHRGRPQKAVNWLIVDYLCVRQCKLTQIASQLGISPDTLERATRREKGMKFRMYANQQRLRGFAALRVKIWEKAMAGDTKLLIRLGEQYLDLGNPFWR